MAPTEGVRQAYMPPEQGGALGGERLGEPQPESMQGVREAGAMPMSTGEGAGGLAGAPCGASAPMQNMGQASSMPPTLGGALGGQPVKGCSSRSSERLRSEEGSYDAAAGAPCPTLPCPADAPDDALPA